MLKKIAMLAAAMSVALVGAVGLSAQGAAAPTPIGAWFGIARPCTATPFTKPAGTEDPTICRLACNAATCPVSNFPVNEVTMIPTILADGTVLADDFAELLDHHSTAQGKWKFVGVESVDGRPMERYQATFIWFQARNPSDIDPRNPLSTFAGVVRPRFVTFFDKDNPDLMRGFIQPYLYPMTDQFGIVNLLKGTPFPQPDPIAPLPANCDPTLQAIPYCFGTLHFYIRRIQAQ
jgi:hypothetical protein